MTLPFFPSWLRLKCFKLHKSHVFFCYLLTDSQGKNGRATTLLLLWRVWCWAWHGTVCLGMLNFSRVLLLQRCSTIAFAPSELGLADIVGFVKEIILGVLSKAYRNGLNDDP